MKIAKITLNGYFNYGNVLQNYALQNVLLKYADEVDTIWQGDYDFLPIYSRKFNLKKCIKLMLNWRGCRKYIFSEKFGMEMSRQTRIRDFCERYINIRCDVGYDTDITDDYDYFVVGSDQVWNPNGKGFGNFFLKFVPNNKRISYAASISSPNVPDRNMQEFVDGIMGMKDISVREYSGAELIKKITGRTVSVNVDPTLLLDADEWRNLEEIPLWYKNEKFILTYFLGEIPLSVKKILEGMEFHIINLLDESSYAQYVTNIGEFLWAIDHAELVYTDSFHGTVFSILFRTPFVICNRIDFGMYTNMESRIDTLLKSFSLEERRGRKENDYIIENPLLSPDWSSVDEVLEHERVRADEYLRKALGKI